MSRRAIGRWADPAAHSSARQRVVEAERSLRESHPDCKIVRYCCGAPLSHVGAINYLAQVGDVSMVARDRNMCPQRTILLVRA